MARNGISLKASSTVANYKPRLSLIICTRDRADSLKRALTAIPAKEMEEVGGELVLVDNGSTDHTPQVAREYAGGASYPVTIMREETPGLGLARNTGLAAAHGDILAFTDDDCYLEPGYIHTAAAVFDDGRFQYCGGRILLHDPDDAMVAVNYKERFALIPPRSFVHAGRIQGANMVVRREVVDTIGPFDPELGAGRAFRCEDAEFVARASVHGFTGAHVPELVVRHHHGRRTAGLPELHKQNHIARGAYYAIMLSRGQWKYALGWAVYTLAPRPRAILTFDYFRRIRYEVRGALGYWKFRRAS